MNIKMRSVTKNNMLKFIELKKQYIKLKDKDISDLELLNIINDYTDNVINKDKRYYSKLSSYEINKNDLIYCL